MVDVHDYVRQNKISIATNTMTSRCIICNIHFATAAIENKSLILYNEIYTLFTTHKLLLRTNRYYCNTHDINNHTELYDNIPKEEIDRSTSTKINSFHKSLRIIDYYKSKLIEELKEEIKQKEDHECKFKFDNLSDEDCKAFCRLNKAQITELSLRYNIDKTKLIIFYTVCYRNIPNAFSKIIFGVSYGQISKIFRKILTTLHNNFVPNELNRDWDRTKIQNATPDYIKQLYSLNDDQTLLMTDGTMVYVPKSGQFHFQKREYNKHKARNCVIFMPIIATNGRYVICLGPYNSDKYNR